MLPVPVVQFVMVIAMHLIFFKFISIIAVVSFCNLIISLQHMFMTICCLPFS